jgi:hypothetical protein
MARSVQGRRCSRLLPSLAYIRGPASGRLPICAAPVAKQSGEGEVGARDVGLLEIQQFSFDAMADSGGGWEKWGMAKLKAKERRQES